MLQEILFITVLSPPSVSVCTFISLLEQNQINREISKRQETHFSGLFSGDLKAYTMARTTDLANTQKLNIYPNTRS